MKDYSDHVQMTLAVDRKSYDYFISLCNKGHRTHIGQLRYLLEKELEREQKEKATEELPQ